MVVRLRLLPGFASPLVPDSLPFRNDNRSAGVILSSEAKPGVSLKVQIHSSAFAERVVVLATRRLIKGTSEETDESGNRWTVYTDGSSASDGSGGGVVVISQEGFKAYYSVRFRYKVPNNEAKYEALLCRLKLVASMKVDWVHVRCDSKLVVGNIMREFEAKDERMKRYRDAALDLFKAFRAYRVEQVPRRKILRQISSSSSAKTPWSISERCHKKKSWDKAQLCRGRVPSKNGWVENTNRTIIDGLKEKIMEYKSAWVEELPYILRTYRTTPRKATGEMPFALTYGFEVYKRFCDEEALVGKAGLKVTCFCNVWVGAKSVQDVVSASEVAELKDSAFGIFFKLGGIKWVNGQLLILLALNQVEPIKRSGDVDRIKFHIGERIVEFKKSDFALITGLKFGKEAEYGDTDLEKANDISTRCFNGKMSVTHIQVENVFN
ncbi:unnamed protein product, partial [Cuscuta campestris]